MTKALTVKFTSEQFSRLCNSLRVSHDTGRGETLVFRAEHLRRRADTAEETLRRLQQDGTVRVTRAVTHTTDYETVPEIDLEVNNG